ncbi:MAG: hypothetical protein GTO45_31020, partial [Candidatus Aminicenantes bacterium]|nr:hypothetical protein [Candidatus Aminicenantes bacterium]NIM78160.1 hypothetical protein [Candidatus Aminicenantes bacterium]NIN22601.1 hypothetical protein [Candidatus Aminicenantes bacterium]NIN46363.1 hypothetical protein [Candidatus Aminicenantes bacterium]NIN89211.1 hypothetical protein [Candidatus Aminicenantes bacterium]
CIKTKIRINFNFKRLFFLFFAALLVQNLFCQNSGRKYFQNYSPKEYKWHNQNWSILQDKRGIIYVGNNNGLLEFDGITWRKIIIPNRTVRSMALDENTGTIYIGGKDQIGFLTPDSKGTLEYKSLLHQLDKDKQNFSEVWRTHFTKEGIYFRTWKYLFRWNPASKQLNVWEPEAKGYRFNASFTCNGKLFVHQRDVGLMQIKNNSLKLV